MHSAFAMFLVLTHLALLSLLFFSSVVKYKIPPSPQYYRTLTPLQARMIII
jgi:hypothetical protein